MKLQGACTQLPKRDISGLSTCWKCPKKEFENSECFRKKWTIAEALGVSESDLPTKGTNEYNVFMRVRELVRSNLDLGGKNSWLNSRGDDFIIKLLQRKLACV